MSKRIAKNLFSTLLFVALLLILAIPTVAKTTTEEEPAENLDIHDETPKKETFLDLIFGSSTPLPTERGILIIDAFEDLNRNGIQDSDEQALLNEVSCQIDSIDYSIPAFIPGLDYNGRYKIRCSSESYSLYSPPRDVFIERRGHVIEVSLPCGKINER